MATRTAQTLTGFNSGILDTVSAGIDVGDAKLITIFLKAASGEAVPAVLTCQCSHDGVTWFDMTTTSGALADPVSKIMQLTDFGSNFFRLKATTKSTVASSLDIVVQIK